jgi:hypothetical protein
MSNEWSYCTLLNYIMNQHSVNLSLTAVHKVQQVSQRLINILKGLRCISMLPKNLQCITSQQNVLNSTNEGTRERSSESAHCNIPFTYTKMLG